MRKITAGLFISLDGVVEAPETWHFPYFDDEMGEAVSATLAAADTLLLGRKTYDSFAGAWPDREAEGGEDAEFAKVIGDTRKIVVSGQELQFSWRNSELLRGDLTRLGFRETALVPTSGHPGVWGYYDAGAAKTLAVYMMYDVQPVDTVGWQVPGFDGAVVDQAVEPGTRVPVGA